MGKELLCFKDQDTVIKDLPKMGNSKVYLQVSRYLEGISSYLDESTVRFIIFKKRINTGLLAYIMTSGLHNTCTLTLWALMKNQAAIKDLPKNNKLVQNLQSCYNPLTLEEEREVLNGLHVRALSGVSNAQNSLGDYYAYNLFYDHPSDLPFHRDLTKAITYYKDALSNGFPVSGFHLCEIYKNEKRDFNTAGYYLRQAYNTKYFHYQKLSNNYLSKNFTYYPFYDPSRYKYVLNDIKVYVLLSIRKIDSHLNGYSRVILALIFILFIIFYFDLRSAKKKNILLCRIFYISSKIALLNKKPLTYTYINKVYRDQYNTLFIHPWIKAKGYFIKTKIKPVLNARFGIEIRSYNLQPHIYNLLGELLDNVVDRYYSHYDTEFNENMNPYQFERYCGRLLAKAGWSVFVTPGSGDQGADIIADKIKSRLVVQCKLYNRPVNNKAVQEVFSSKSFYRAHFALVVTNSNFTKSALQLAHRTGVKLCHHSELAKVAHELLAQP